MLAGLSKPSWSFNPLVSCPLQGSSVCEAPAVWFIRPWWASRQQQTPARVCLSACCSIYWELGHISRGDLVPPTNWSRVLPRQLQTHLMWACVSYLLNLYINIEGSSLWVTINTLIFFTTGQCFQCKLLWLWSVRSLHNFSSCSSWRCEYQPWWLFRCSSK